MNLSEGGSLSGGSWVVSSGSVRSNFAVPALGYGNTKNVANWASTSQASTALVTRGGDNCKVPFNDNSN